MARWDDTDLALARRLDWDAIRGFFRRQSADRIAMKAFVLERFSGETVVVAFMIVLFAFGFVGSLLGGMAAGDAAQFWQNFVGGVAVLALMTIPIWFLQRWQAMARPRMTRARLREVQRIRLFLIVLWLTGLGIAGGSLAINVSQKASVEANVAVGLLFVYLVGWGLLVFRVLGGSPFPGGRPRARWFGAKTK